MATFASRNVAVEPVLSVRGDSGEERLIAAILLQAARDFHVELKVYGVPRAWGTEVGHWLRSEETRPFGFRWCCDMLDVDPQRFRKCIVERETLNRLKESTWLRRKRYAAEREVGDE